MKPRYPGYYWRRIKRRWQPVLVARRWGGLVYQSIGALYSYDVRDDGAWGGRCEGKP